MQNINFIQKNKILSSYDNMEYGQEIGLLEDFLGKFNSHKSNIFAPTKIVVQNIGMENWLKDYIAKSNSICANISCSVLLNPFIEEIYKINNPHIQLFDLAKAKFIIYDYICSSGFLDSLDNDASYIRDFLFNNDNIDFYKAFQLAIQLQTIFSEYLYLRTRELLDLSLFDKKNKWQKKIWQMLLLKIDGQKTYLDIYQFFLTNSELKNIPKNIYIFGLSNIYPSQMDILKKIAKYSTINWYYLSISNNYYGDLFNSLTKARLQHKILSSDIFEVSDLHLTEGNPLVANLAQQSREFIELLLNYEIIESELESPMINAIVDYTPKSLLNLIQSDIRNIVNRLDGKLILYPNQENIVKPVAASSLLKNNIKVNVCHNKMREIQVLFNEACGLLVKNPNLTLADFVVLAPKIEDYIPYIKAVFDNEFINDIYNNEIKIPYTIINNFTNPDLEIIKVVKELLNMPYNISMSSFLELINQTEIKKNFSFSQNDLERIDFWLQENNIRWGLDAYDYKQYGYSDFDINTFKRFLINLSLGFCIPEDIYWQRGKVPMYIIDDKSGESQYYVGYDNLESGQLNLCNKLISLVNVIKQVRRCLYNNNLEYANISMKDIISLIEYIKVEIITNPDGEIAIDNFIGYLKLNCLNLDLQINLPIFNSLIEELFVNKGENAIFTGKLIFASMQSMRNIPFSAVYILGMNFGGFPRNYNLNNLSIISKNWALADRNFNLEDKQLFLDIILATREFLFISYIGRDENTNIEKRPSTVVSLLLETIKNSVINGSEKLAEITHIHSLHPFYNNSKPNYSVFWGKVNKLINSDSENNYIKEYDSIVFSQKYQEYLQQVNCKKLINTFLYSNSNLYSLVGLSIYNKVEEINDYEDFELESRQLYKNLYKEFNKIEAMYNKQLFNETLLQLKDNGNLKNYLYAKGVLSYEHLGDYQLDKVLNLYLAYSLLRGAQKAIIDFNYSKYNIKINDQVWIDFKNENNNEIVLVICDEFINIKSNERWDDEQIIIPYPLQIKSLIFYLLAKNAKFINSNNEILKVDNVQLRLINQELKTVIYQVKLKDNIDTAYIFDEICEFFINSLFNPVLIHKKAIEEYIKPLPLKYKNLSNEEIKNYRINRAKSIYMGKYENYDLESLKADPIFAKIAENYFILAAKDKNTLIKIGNWLLNLVLIKEDN